MIPLDRPVLNGDVLAVQERLDLACADLAWLLGLAPDRWARLVHDARNVAMAERVLADPRLALILRWLDRMPLVRVTVPGPEPQEFFGRLRLLLGGGITAKLFGLALGLDGTAGHRFITLGGRPSATIRRALGLVDAAPGALATNWRQWAETALLEARLRGAPDLIRRGRWPQVNGRRP